ncbi:ABC transporter permease [Planctellipticum variicoloris]|uniref:ABC transporter permease n=1 Tax=Planctellipticum variicoloris TaxID=3064265 RepID=UPI0030138D9B|nr:ABC-2 family transporter protein [Planctomycetaceae bacterium SH412]
MNSTTLRTKWFILRTSIDERLAYRGDFAFATLVRFLPIVTQVFLWGAIYQAQSAGEERVINSYRYSDMVAYYLLVMVGRAFSSMPGLTSGIARDVRDGSIKRFLTQPVDLIDWMFWNRVAHKLVYYAVATGPFLLVFYLCRDYFRQEVTPTLVAAWIASLIMAFLVGFLIEALLGLLAFWFLEVSSLIFIYMLLSYFLSGHMLPLDWLPEPVAGWIQWLPFKYLAFFPSAVILGRYSPPVLARELLIEAGWVVVLYLANRWALKRGLRRYSAYGG